MKKTYASAVLFLFITVLFAAGQAEEEPATIIAGSSDAELFPFKKHQAIAVQYLDSEEAALSLADASGVQSSIRFSCKRGKFCFVPSSREAPEFLIYDDSDNLLTW